MSALTYYPVNDYGPIMKGLVIGGLGIFHVFLAQFAIGGGMLMLYFQHLSTRKDAATGAPDPVAPLARRFVDGYFKILVLISFVVGALTGVAMWFISIQVSAPTIGMMIREFHWLWATEYTAFWLEVFAGYAFYRYGKVLSDPNRTRLLVLYTFGGWMSLFWINGILSWQLTPGTWVPGGSIWPGFFNPTFWPSLLFRTAASAVIAALVGMVIINSMPLEQAQRRLLINRAAHLLVPLLAMPILGAWFLWAMPADSRSWATGGSVAMTMFMSMSVGASVLLGGYALIGLLLQRLYINGATATLLVALAFFATAGGEFVREGSRKPYSVRGNLYSNSITPDLVRVLRVRGSTTDDPYPLRNPAEFPTPQLQLGAKVYRTQCSVCHTVSGSNGLTHLTGSWLLDQIRFNVANLQHTKPFMPPFSGTPEELEAIVQKIAWENAGRPATWSDTAGDAALIAHLRALIDQAGDGPGDFERFRDRQRANDRANGRGQTPSSGGAHP